jgi:putative membrane protein
MRTSLAAESAMRRWHALLETPGRRRQSAFFHAVTACVERLRHETGATVAVVVREASGTYLDVAFLFGSVVSWLGLLLILLMPQPIHHYMVLLDVALLFVVASWLCARTPLGTWLTPRLRRRRQVKTAAHAAFFEEETHHVRNDHGVLIFWSRREGRIEVLTGPAVPRAVPTRDWNAAVFALRAAARHSQAEPAFLVAVAEMGRLLARYFPPDPAAHEAHTLTWRAEK